MIAHLAEIHEKINLRDSFRVLHFHGHKIVPQGTVHCQAIVFLLQGGHTAVYNDIPLRGIQRRVQNIPLQSAEDKRTQNLVQFGDNTRSLLGVDDVLHFGVLSNVTEAEPRLEDLQVSEYHWRAEVEQRPELFETVLNRSAS